MSGVAVDRGTDGLWEVTSTVLVDATETGDVLALAGAAYRSGNGSVDPALPGSQAQGAVQDITWPAVMRRYPRTASGVSTVPAVLSLVGRPFPTMSDDPVPQETQAAVLAWFRSQVDDVSGTTSFTARPWTFAAHNRYRGLPDVSASGAFVSTDAESVSRTVVNFANDYPNASAGDPWSDLPVAYLEDAGFRRDVDCRAKMRTIQFVWYVQNVLGYVDWAVANDEGLATAWNRSHLCPGMPSWLDAVQRHMPLRPYIRESRRGIGVGTVTASDIYRAPHGGAVRNPAGRVVTSSLAAPTRRGSALVGYYRIDLHGARADALLESDLESRTDWPPSTPVLPYGPYSIPLNTFVPRDLDGLLFAEKNFSQSRSVNGASRLQPETSLGGMAVGALAALSVRQGLASRHVAPVDVQWEISNHGGKLATNRFVDVAATAPVARWADLSAVWDTIPYERQTTLGPDIGLTRAAAAGYVRRAVGLPPGTPTAGRFSDWSATAAYARDVEALARAGVSMSCRPSELCPSAAVSRAQLASWFVAAYDAVTGTRWGSSYIHTGAPLTDVAVSSTRTSRSIYVIVDHMVLVAPGSRFRPSEQARRYEALVMAPQVARWVQRGGLPART